MFRTLPRAPLQAAPWPMFCGTSLLSWCTQPSALPLPAAALPAASQGVIEQVSAAVGTIDTCYKSFGLFPNYNKGKSELKRQVHSVLSSRLPIHHTFAHAVGDPGGDWRSILLTDQYKHMGSQHTTSASVPCCPGQDDGRLQRSASRCC